MEKEFDSRIFSAEEARKQTLNEIETDDSELLPIMEAIKKAIKRKDFYCHYSGNIHEYTKDKLKNLGYKIEYISGSGDQREPGYFKISWHGIRILD